MNRRFAIPCFAASVLLVGASARGGDAGDQQQSAALFREGVSAGKAGDYERAEAAFRGAYALTPSPSTLRNLALTEMRLGKMVDALGHLKVAVRAPGLTTEQRRIVQQNLDDAFAATGHLSVETTAGAQVVVDGLMAEGAAPFADPLDVPAGSRHVEARLGSAVVQADVEAPAGRVVAIALPVVQPSQPPPEPVAAPTEVVPAPGTGNARGSRATTWWTVPHGAAVALGAAGALGLGLGFYFNAASNSAASDANGLRSALAGRCTGAGAAPECAALRAKISEVHQDETLANASFAFAGAAAVGAAVLLAVAGPGASTRTGSLRWTPAIAPGGAGIAGSF